MGINLQLKRLEYILWLNEMLLELKRSSEYLGIDNGTSIKRIAKRIRALEERAMISYYLST